MKVQDETMVWWKKKSPKNRSRIKQLFGNKLSLQRLKAMPKFFSFSETSVYISISELNLY